MCEAIVAGVLGGTLGAGLALLIHKGVRAVIALTRS